MLRIALRCGTSKGSADIRLHPLVLTDMSETVLGAR